MYKPSFELSLLMFGKHFAGGKAHDSSAHRGKHAELEAGEGYGRGAKAGGHKQGGGYWHLAGVLIMHDRERDLVPV